jgi:hypothetical protein
MPRALFMLRNHFPGAVALVALAITVILTFWLNRDAAVAPIAFDDWRQFVFIFCAGLAVGGLAAELSAFVARTSPGETPVGSTVIAAIFALPSYGFMILLLLVAQD